MPDTTNSLDVESESVPSPQGWGEDGSQGVSPLGITQQQEVPATAGTSAVLAADLERRANGAEPVAVDPNNPDTWPNRLDPAKDAAGVVHQEDALRVTRDTAVVIWNENLASVLEEIRRYYRRYVVVTDIQADAIALWVVHTYVYDEFRATPYLHFWSPEPESGKTTSLEVLEPIVRDGFVVDDATGAVLYRFVDDRKPTLLFDEVDGVFSKKDDDSKVVQKILNSGYKKGKRVLRMGGGENDGGTHLRALLPEGASGVI